VIDHLDLVVTSLERSLDFYRGLLGPLGYGREGEIAGERGERVVYLNTAARIGSISLREAQTTPGTPYDRYSLGVHHVAFRCASREVVQERAGWLREQGAEISSGPREFDYTPGYFAELELVHRPMPYGATATVAR
jgi:glyoxylase I family protein